MGMPQIWQMLFGQGTKLVSEIIPFGTTAGTVAQGNDARIAGATPTTRKIIADAGLSGGGDLKADIKLALDMGYDPTKDYKKPCTVLSSSGELYLWQKASGPGVAGVGAKTPGAAGSNAYWVPANAAATAADAKAVAAANSIAPAVSNARVAGRIEDGGQVVISGKVGETQYTAQEDGFIFFAGNCNTNNVFSIIISQTAFSGYSLFYSQQAFANLRATISAPIKKGYVARIIVPVGANTLDAQFFPLNKD